MKAKIIIKRLTEWAHDYRYKGKPIPYDEGLHDLEASVDWYLKHGIVYQGGFRKVLNAKKIYKDGKVYGAELTLDYEDNPNYWRR